MSETTPEFIADEFLAKAPDCPVFGLNLACVYPFPAEVKAAYEEMGRRLETLDDNVYVYPYWETHVTILTFLSFVRHRQLSAKHLQELRGFIRPLQGALKNIFDSDRIAPFELQFQPPVLTPKAAILMALNPSGEINRIRHRARALLEADPSMSEPLARGGFNIPGIIHSTILRFKRPPREPARFKSDFDALAATTKPISLKVSEILLTTETKPYMRAGEIVHRFTLES